MRRIEQAPAEGGFIAEGSPFVLRGTRFEKAEELAAAEEAGRGRRGSWLISPPTRRHRKSE